MYSVLYGHWLALPFFCNPERIEGLKEAMGIAMAMECRFLRASIVLSETICRGVVTGSSPCVLCSQDVGDLVLGHCIATYVSRQVCFGVPRAASVVVASLSLLNASLIADRDEDDGKEWSWLHEDTASGRGARPRPRAHTLEYSQRIINTSRCEWTYEKCCRSSPHAYAVMHMHGCAYRMRMQWCPCSGAHAVVRECVLSLWYLWKNSVRCQSCWLSSLF